MAFFTTEWTIPGSSASMEAVWDVYETSASLECSFLNGQSGFKGTRYIRVTVNNRKKDPIPGENSKDGADSTFLYEIKYLSPGTLCTWKIEFGFQSGDNIQWLTAWTKEGTFTTEQKKPSVTAWSWEKSNGSAEDWETEDAYDAITSNGPTTDFSYKVWNDLVSKTNETIQAAGRSWDSFYLSFEDTKMTKDNKVITADRFNSLRNNINFGHDTKLPVVKKGDVIKGKYFITLASGLNSWINSL